MVLPCFVERVEWAATAPPIALTLVRLVICTTSYTLQNLTLRLNPAGQQTRTIAGHNSARLIAKSIESRANQESPLIPREPGVFTPHQVVRIPESYFGASRVIFASPMVFFRER